MAVKKLEFGSFPRFSARRAEGCRAPVLLALRGSEYASFASIRRAVALSRELCAEVHVVRVASSAPAWPSRSRKPDAARADDPLTMHEAERATRAQLAVLTSSELPWSHYHVRAGSFVEQVTRHIAVIRARLVVLSDEPSLGSTAVALACRSGVLVLVARYSTANRTLVAHPDLDSVGSILTEARRCDADLIVARMPSSSSTHRVARAVACQLVDQAVTSVLIEPPGRGGPRVLA